MNEFEPKQNKTKWWVAGLVTLLISSIGVAGLPPTTLSALFDTVKTTMFNFIVPNKQFTAVVGGGLIETGNTNLLSNPSFEHTVFNTGWTCTGVTPLEELSAVAHGKKSMLLAVSGNFECYQDSTINNLNALGMQFLASALIRGPTNLTGTVKVCSGTSGTTSTTNCMSIFNNGVFTLYKVPFVGGSTSNRISIVGTGSPTGNIYVDNTFMGPSDNIVSFDQTKFLGGVSYGAATAATSWRNYSGTGTLDSGTTGLTYNDTSKEINLVEGGDYKLDYSVSYAVNTTSTPDLAVGIAINGTTEQCVQTATGGNATGPRPLSTCNIKNLPPNSKIILRVYTGSSVAHAGARVDVIRFPSTGYGYSSVNADYGPTAFTPTITYQTGGATNITWTGMKSRRGKYMLLNVKGVFSSTSAAFSVPTLTIPDGLSIDTAALLIGPNSFKLNGWGSSEDAATANYYAVPDIFSSTAVVVQGLNSAGTNLIQGDISNTNPFTFNTGDAITFGFEVPISQWAQSNVMIGSFRDVVTSIGSNNSSSAGADIQAVFFGSGAGCSSSCTTGTCTICTQIGSKITSVTWQQTGWYRLNGIDGTKYICSGSGWSGTQYLIGFDDKTDSTSSYKLFQLALSPSTNTNGGLASVTCMGVP